MNTLRDLFLLDPEVVFLNHGSFGATPRPVFEVYQEWQRRLEAQPVKFLGREIGGYLRTAREALAAFLHAGADDLVFVPNATFGINVVARSLDLGPGDEVLSTNHEYGACDNVWEYLGRQRGFRVVRQPIPLPLTTTDDIVEQVWAGVTARTRVIFISHITSPTAVHLPIEAICARAREAGILTVIDGAHAPGQIELDVPAVGADFYTGNAHKWLMAPKGAAFLYARPDAQRLIEPLVVGWGWGEHRTMTFGNSFLDYNQWLGTNDLSAYLAVPAAIAFMDAHDWPAVRARCHALVSEAVERLNDLTGLESIYPKRDSGFFHQMAAAPLPAGVNPFDLQKRLYDEYRVEIPCLLWQDRPLIRVSIQGYNTPADVDALLAAVGALLPQLAA